MVNHGWTAEKLASLDLPKLKSLRDNAIAKYAKDLAALCEQEIEARRPKKGGSQSVVRRHGSNGVVVEYHFVCRDDRGVTTNPDASFWSASWVVSEQTLIRSIKHGTMFCLHNSKDELSYRQGKVVEYRRIEDFEDGEVESRIDFLVVPSGPALEWFGDGTGEKGYRWLSSNA